MKYPTNRVFPRERGAIPQGSFNLENTMNLFNVLFLILAGAVLLLASGAALIQGGGSPARTQWTHVFVLGLFGAMLLAMAYVGGAA